jgi:hypothetical protein
MVADWWQARLEPDFTDRCAARSIRAAVVEWFAFIPVPRGQTRYLSDQRWQLFDRFRVFSLLHYLFPKLKGVLRKSVRSVSKLVVACDAFQVAGSPISPLRQVIPM